jgi:hypothetical protein
MKLPIDEARLLPRFRDRVQLERQQADVFREEFERAGKAGIDTTKPRARGNDRVVVDRLELRGLPVIGAYAGAIPGTQPEQALVAKDYRRSRSRSR